MRKEIKIVLVVLLLLSAPLLAISTDVEGDGDYRVLVDSGNGSTLWSSVKTTEADTNEEVVSAAVTALGMEFELKNGMISIDGKTETTIGGGDSNPSFTNSGTSSKVVTSQWRLYLWNEDKWDETPVSALEDKADGTPMAAGFYPDDCVPIETPEYPDSWTMIQGDAKQSGSQTTDVNYSGDGKVSWVNRGQQSMGMYTSALVYEEMVFLKYGQGTKTNAHVDCIDRFTGDVIWKFEFPGMLNYEITTPLLVNGYIFVPAAHGYIYKIPVEAGPGVDNSNVTTFNGEKFNWDKMVNRDGAIPAETGAELTGSIYSTGPGSLVYDSGCIYANSSNGMAYCFNMDLELIWAYQMKGHTYFMSPVIYDDYYMSGAYDGSLYILDKQTGEEVASTEVYTQMYNGKMYGSVTGIAVLEQKENYNLIVSFSNGRGMSSNVGGVAIYNFNNSGLREVYKDTETFGMVGNYLIPYQTENYSGAFFTCSNGLYKIDVEGTYQQLNGDIEVVKAAPTFVNGEKLFFTSYVLYKPIFITDLDGKILNTINPPSDMNNYCMSSAVVIGDWIYTANDSGAFAIQGELPEYVYIIPEVEPWYSVLLPVVLVIIGALAVFYSYMRFVKKINKPFSWIVEQYDNYIHSEAYTHNTKSRHRLRITILVGLTLTALMFIACLCVGPTLIMSVPDMFANLFSAIGKGGENLTYEELAVYNSRLPRTMAALAVGVGLSIAGSMYQAIIRNPLVDPYIMGVSAGAGTAALAVIAFDFTFFGLFAPHSIYLTAASAMVGGVIAVLATMLIAEKAGGSSINYVLAGVVVGLAFSAIQTLMMSMAGERLSNAITWLFGSFSGISWVQVGMVVIPALVLSLVPLIWAKEFNLVLLGEDQAKQMGLNVVWFNRTMLILASILTSVCVAFVGIIGFVGLVVPHVCRMILGGDHRLVMPASIAIGGLLMMFADLASRMIYYGQELPVGAITTLIGVPVFAYLLIRRGKMYDG